MGRTACCSEPLLNTTMVDSCPEDDVTSASFALDLLARHRTTHRQPCEPPWAMGFLPAPCNMPGFGGTCHFLFVWPRRPYASEAFDACIVLSWSPENILNFLQRVRTALLWLGPRCAGPSRSWVRWPAGPERPPCLTAKPRSASTAWPFSTGRNSG